MEREGGHDEDGIVWPESIAPYRVVVVPIGGGKSEGSEFLREKGRELCDLLGGSETFDDDDVMFDDRVRESPGTEIRMLLFFCFFFLTSILTHFLFLVSFFLGVKLKEASLSGIPWIIVLGKDALPTDRTLWKKEKEVELLHHLMEVEGEGTVEIQERGTGIKVNVKYGEVLSYLKKHSRCRTASEMLQNGFEEQDNRKKGL